MNNTLLVSIVVPVYNSEKTISKCLDSLISQTFKDIEIICVNDCSKDNSLKVLNEYASKDSRIVVINHEENMNAGGARNSGIKAAKGEYVCFVDNDDWLDLNTIEGLLNKSKDLTADLILTDLKQVFPDGSHNIINNIPDNLPLNEKIKWGLLNGAPLLGSLIKRQLFLSNNLFYPEKIFYEDNPVHFALLTCSSSVVSTQIAYYNYYHSPNSVTRSTSIKKIQDRIFTTNLFLHNTKRIGSYSQYKEYIEATYIHLTCHTISLLSRVSLYKGFRILNTEFSKLTKFRNSDAYQLVSHKYKKIARFPHLWYCFNRIKCLIINLKSKS